MEFVDEGFALAVEEGDPVAGDFEEDLHQLGLVGLDEA